MFCTFCKNSQYQIGITNKLLNNSFLAPSVFLSFKSKAKFKGTGEYIELSTPETPKETHKKWHPIDLKSQFRNPESHHGVKFRLEKKYLSRLDPGWTRGSYLDPHGTGKADTIRIGNIVLVEEEYIVNGNPVGMIGIVTQIRRTRSGLLSSFALMAADYPEGEDQSIELVSCYERLYPINHPGLRRIRVIHQEKKNRFKSARLSYLWPTKKELPVELVFKVTRDGKTIYRNDEPHHIINSEDEPILIIPETW